MAGVGSGSEVWLHPSTTGGCLETMTYGSAKGTCKARTVMWWRLWVTRRYPFASKHAHVYNVNHYG